MDLKVVARRRVAANIFFLYRFLNKVTSEILRQGIFSDKGIRKALDSCLALNKEASSVISGLEKENLVNQLKQELGEEIHAIIKTP